MPDDFASWFAGSKLEREGRPMVLFHGTNQEFDTFREGVVYLTTNRPYAEEMGQSMVEYAGGTLHMMELHACLRTPAIMEIEDIAWLKDMPEEVERLRALGHDGAMDVDHLEIVAFGPEQVRLRLASVAAKASQAQAFVATLNSKGPRP